MNSKFLRVLRLPLLLPLGLVLLILAPLEWLARTLWWGFFMALVRFFFMARLRGEPPLAQVEMKDQPAQQRSNTRRQRNPR